MTTERDGLVERLRQAEEALRDKAAIHSNPNHRAYWTDRADWVREAADALSAAQRQEREFPIQRERGAKPHPMLVPWSIAERAYSVYSARYGNDQSLERLAERGGFGPSEMDTYYPEWREATSEIAAWRKRAEEAEALLSERSPQQEEQTDGLPVSHSATSENQPPERGGQ